MKKYGIITLLFLLLSLRATAQTYPEFDSLKQKAYSAWELSDYVASLSYFQKLLSLPANKTPAPESGLYYDIACIYSRNDQTESAFEFLNKSFSLAHLRNGTTPVGIDHIASDTDLNFIRNDPRFENLVKKYYSSRDVTRYMKWAAFDRLKEVSYQEVLEFIQSPEGSMEIRNKTIYWKKGSDDSLLYNNSALEAPTADRLKTESIDFVNCTFRLNFIWNMQSQENGQRHPFYRINFKKCHFEGRFSMNEVRINGRGELRFEECIFDQTFLLLPKFDLEVTWGGCFIERCTFHLGNAYINSSVPMSFLFVENQLLENFYLSAKSIDVCTIRGNQSKTGILGMWMIDTDVLRVNKNRVPTLEIKGHMDTEFDFEKNEIAQNIIFADTFFPESVANDIDWPTLNQGRLALSADHGEGGLSWNTAEGRLIERGDLRSRKLLTGKLDEDISDESNFRHLMGVYSMFLNLYKSKSDIESYNSCFVDIKELQSRRLKYQYQSKKGFESYFSWKLSQLLKFYVVHGTKPARAIVISIYIIFWFGLFFFFFPSDWDVTSKKKLIQNFKDFIQKNEKGYIKPFFILLSGLFVSMLNALTLSLNAFITLGFGNIPTHGIARYVCVLEGFIGWFLLSIFTVALINQVL